MPQQLVSALQLVPPPLLLADAACGGCRDARGSRRTWHTPSVQPRQLGAPHRQSICTIAAGAQGVDWIGQYWGRNYQPLARSSNKSAARPHKRAGAGQFGQPQFPSLTVLLYRSRPSVLSAGR